MVTCFRSPPYRRGGGGEATPRLSPSEKGAARPANKAAFPRAPAPPARLPPHHPRGRPPPPPNPPDSRGARGAKRRPPGQFPPSRRGADGDQAGPRKEPGGEYEKPPAPTRPEPERRQCAGM